MIEVPAGVGDGLGRGVPVTGVAETVGDGVGLGGVCAAPCTHAWLTASAASKKTLVRKNFGLLDLNN